MKKYAERSEAKKNTEKLKEGLKSSILGPQNLGSGGARAPRAPPGSASDWYAVILAHHWRQDVCPILQRYWFVAALNLSPIQTFITPLHQYRGLLKVILAQI